MKTLIVGICFLLPCLPGKCETPLVAEEHHDHDCKGKDCKHHHHDKKDEDHKEKEHHEEQKKHHEEHEKREGY